MPLHGAITECYSFSVMLHHSTSYLIQRWSCKCRKRSGFCPSWMIEWSDQDEILRVSIESGYEIVYLHALKSWRPA